MKSLQKAFACLALCAAAGTSVAEPAALSFADVYRLTVAGPLAVAAPAAEALPEESASAGAGAPAQPLQRVAAGEGEGYAFSVAAARPGSERSQAAYQFSVAALPEPQSWLLLASGLLLAAWVVRRRLFNSL